MPHPAFPPHTPLVLGTYNLKKLLELCELLAPLGSPLKMLTDFPQAITVEETGDSFAANAALKASEQALHLKAWVLGEDSGLSVDALGGRPGIFSARYAGPGASDGDNNRLLLEELAAVPHDRRTAHYTCHVALSDPAGQIVARNEAYCQGLIRFEPVGTAGFGYDPLFEIAEYHRTFGQLGIAVKRVLSHRARAVAQLVEMLT
ncbi:MAG TPA: non-canonical purine NTP pyrophosphatase [Pirellulales bacterium]|jgi:XTP/dITP diphosphohydrolase|nr:non-canonical purine NTP pyrophosphatase [Pirellulales bacterium]